MVLTLKELRKKHSKLLGNKAISRLNYLRMTRKVYQGQEGNPTDEEAVLKRFKNNLPSIISAYNSLRNYQSPSKTSLSTKCSLPGIIKQ